MAPLHLVIQISLILLSVAYEMTHKEPTRINVSASTGDALLFLGDSQVFYGEAMSYGFLNVLRREISLLNAGSRIQMTSCTNCSLCNHLRCLTASLSLRIIRLPFMFTIIGLTVLAGGRISPFTVDALQHFDLRVHSQYPSTIFVLTGNRNQCLFSFASSCSLSISLNNLLICLLFPKAWIHWCKLTKAMMKKSPNPSNPFVLNWNQQF